MFDEIPHRTLKIQRRKGTDEEGAGEEGRTRGEKRKLRHDDEDGGGYGCGRSGGGGAQLLSYNSCVVVP